MSDPTAIPTILPLIPSKPRLRFMVDAAPGAAGDPPVDPKAGEPAPKTEPATPPWGDPKDFDPDKAWKLIENLRTDAEARQTKTDAAIASAATAVAEKAKKDTLAEFGRLLAGEEPVETDPEKLQAKVSDLSTKVKAQGDDLTKAQSDAKAAGLSLAVALLAPSLGANTKLLLANGEFKTAIASVDPGDEAAVTAEITKALQANAALKQPPARTGDGNHTGPTVQSLEAQLAAAVKAGDHATAISLKRRISAAKTA